MARGRMISKAISLDEKVNNLSDDTARLLFTWLIPHLDCEGRLHGDAVTIKSIVFPRRNISPKRIEKYLNEFEKNGLIIRFAVNGNTYLFAPQFNKHQVGLQKSREAQSQIPPPPQELLQSSSSKSLPKTKVKIKTKVYTYIVPDFIDKELWNDFLEMRTKARKPPTDKAKGLLIKDLEKYRADGEDTSEILRRAIKGGWTALYSLKGDRGIKKALPTTKELKEGWNQ